MMQAFINEHKPQPLNFLFLLNKLPHLYLNLNVVKILRIKKKTGEEQ